MKKYQYVFVVLVYRNTDDLVDFIKSVEGKVKNYKIVIVNSYYDDESKKEFEKIAAAYSCAFLNVENRGYGYGNNKGFEFVAQNYDYDFIVLSNPDIEIKSFSQEVLYRHDDRLIGPEITTRTGKAQNPYWVLDNKICEYLIYLGYKRRSRALFFIGVAVNKIIREACLAIVKLLGKREFSVYALHGSFVIFPKSIVEKVGTAMYDDNMFLFAEEADLARKLKQLRVKSLVTRDVGVYHKEDGSVSVAKIDEKSEARKSVIYYYEKYQKRA